MFNLIAKSTIRTAITASTRTTLPSAFATRFFSDASRVTGTVKWFDAKKGFGFLIPDDGTTDIFVHHSSIHADGFRSLGDGEQVEFEVMEEPNGRLKAMNVTGPNGAPVQGAPRRMSNDGYGNNDGY